jgi:XTP/dITP diphosphohydrolase
MDILIATNNPGKFREIVAVLSDGIADGVNWKSLADIPREIDEPVEDRDTFQGNAELKAVHYSLAAGMWALADDSGLEVDALGGEPGVHSAYYSGLGADEQREVRDAANNEKLAAALAKVPKDRRTARYHCVMVLADGGRVVTTAHGKVEGVMIDEPRGDGGFGYDPYFLIPETGQTMAELSMEAKNRISHRGNALRALREQLRAVLAGAK